MSDFIQPLGVVAPGVDQDRDPERRYETKLVVCRVQPALRHMTGGVRRYGIFSPTPRLQRVRVQLQFSARRGKSLPDGAVDLHADFGTALRFFFFSISNAMQLLCIH